MHTTFSSSIHLPMDILVVPKSWPLLNILQISEKLIAIILNICSRVRLLAHMLVLLLILWETSIMFSVVVDWVTSPCSHTFLWPCVCWVYFPHLDFGHKACPVLSLKHHRRFLLAFLCLCILREMTMSWLTLWSKEEEGHREQLPYWLSSHTVWNTAT